MTAGPLSIDDVSKTYAGARPNSAVRALSRVSLDVGEGEFLSIIGPSGCGKTTLLNMIAGFVTPSTGVVRRGAVAIAGPGPDRTMMFQDYALFPWLTVADNIAFGLRAKGLSRRERETAVARFVDLARLKGFEDRLPHELSGGMRQRVSVARALAPDPDIVLMDEPFAALDSLTRDALQEELLAIWERSGKTFVLVTHNIEEALFLSDRVVVMAPRPGRIQTIVEIPLPRPRSPDLRTRDPVFMALKQRLFDLLHDAPQPSGGR